MEYFYDWAFVRIPSSNIPLLSALITNGMRRRSTDGVEFVVELLAHNHLITPRLVALEMIQFLVLCMLIHILIHYETVCGRLSRK